LNAVRSRSASWDREHHVRLRPFRTWVAHVAAGGRASALDRVLVPWLSDAARAWTLRCGRHPGARRQLRRQRQGRPRGNGGRTRSGLHHRARCLPSSRRAVPHVVRRTRELHRVHRGCRNPQQLHALGARRPGAAAVPHGTHVRRAAALRPAPKVSLATRLQSLAGTSSGSSSSPTTCSPIPEADRTNWRPSRVWSWLRTCTTGGGLGRVGSCSPMATAGCPTRVTAPDPRAAPSQTPVVRPQPPVRSAAPRALHGPPAPVADRLAEHHPAPDEDPTKVTRRLTTCGDVRSPRRLVSCPHAQHQQPSRGPTRLVRDPYCRPPRPLLGVPVRRHDPDALPESTAPVATSAVEQAALHGLLRTSPDRYGGR
jgi:hypothetical protein